MLDNDVCVCQSCLGIFYMMMFCFKLHQKYYFYFYEWRWIQTGYYKDVFGNIGSM